MTPFATYPSLRSAVVLVTGGASGIGEAVVRAFADQGSRTGFVEELAGRGAEARFEPCDLPERRGAVRRHQLAPRRPARRELPDAGRGRDGPRGPSRAPARASAALALHVLEVLEAMLTSGETGRPVTLPEPAGAIRPEPLPEAEAGSLRA